MGSDHQLLVFENRDREPASPARNRLAVAGENNSYTWETNWEYIGCDLLSINSVRKLKVLGPAKDEYPG